MSGKGRPKVEDKRDNQYRVRLNNAENKMLDYSSKTLGIPKSEIFRKALQMYYNATLLNEYESKQEYEKGWESDHISLKRVIKCPYCESGNRVDFEDYLTDTLSSERQMGAEISYHFECSDFECEFCKNIFQIKGSISEYPVGAYDSEYIKVD